MLWVEVGITGIIVSTTAEGRGVAMDGGAEVGKLQATIESKIERGKNQ
jgi:hypothetical protein